MTSSVFLALAVLIDRLLGEPARFHPLVGFGNLVKHMERLLRPADTANRAKWDLRCRGIVAVALLVVPFTLLTCWLAELPWLGAIVQVGILYLAIGATSLTQHAQAIAQALEQHDLPLARYRLSMIVSRDTSELEETDIAKAAIESVLENGSDAVFAALFWFLLLGAPGAMLYRLSNTLDAMWGYKTERFLHFGWAAARFDDVLNYIPARLTALSYILTGNTRTGWVCWRTQAKTWYSPNAGPVMSAGAGSLDIALGGAARYHGAMKERPVLGTTRPPVTEDIQRAIRLVQRSIILWIVAAWMISGLGFYPWH